MERDAIQEKGGIPCIAQWMHDPLCIAAKGKLEHETNHPDVRRCLALAGAAVALDQSMVFGGPALGATFRF
jgi:hypothetical protein